MRKKEPRLEKFSMLGESLVIRFDPALDDFQYYLINSDTGELIEMWVERPSMADVALAITRWQEAPPTFRPDDLDSELPGPDPSGSYWWQESNERPGFSDPIDDDWLQAMQPMYVEVIVHGIRYIVQVVDFIVPDLGCVGYAINDAAWIDDEDVAHPIGEDELESYESCDLTLEQHLVFGWIDSIE